LTQAILKGLLRALNGCEIKGEKEKILEEAILLLLFPLRVLFSPLFNLA
jgi:hypothetical protein